MLRYSTLLLVLLLSTDNVWNPTFAVVAQQQSASSSTLYDNILPLTDEKLDLVSRLAQYSDELFNFDTAAWFAGVKGGTYFTSISVPEFSYNVPLDAAYVFEEDDTNLCIVNFMSTRPNVKDWSQNFDIYTATVHSRSDPSISCIVHGGFYSAYRNATYRQDLEDAIDNCMIKNATRKLIIAGHSQGAAIALIAAVTFEEYKPLVVTYGQPETFVRRDNTTFCTAIPEKNVWRFVNTENNKKNTSKKQSSSFLSRLFGTGSKKDDDSAIVQNMDYDPVAMGGTFTIQGDLSTLNVKLYTGYHIGPSILLPPGDTVGRMMVGTSVKCYKEWPYNNFKNIKYNDAAFDKDFLKGLLLGGIWDAFGSAHSISTYRYKFQYLKSYGSNPLNVKGLAEGSLCNYDMECQPSCSCIQSICSN